MFWCGMLPPVSDVMAAAASVIEGTVVPLAPSDTSAAPGDWIAAAPHRCGREDVAGGGDGGRGRAARADVERERRNAVIVRAQSVVVSRHFIDGNAVGFFARGLSQRAFRQSRPYADMDGHTTAHVR
jgi:hypothetical protein